MARSNQSQISLNSIPVSDPNVKTAEYVKSQQPDMGLNPEATSFKPASLNSPVSDHEEKKAFQCLLTPFESTAKDIEPNSMAAPLQPNLANDLTRFLLRKDLSMSRLSKFNDRAENFLAWKASFSDVVKEMGVSPAEEIDLLVKWLGPESHKHAISLRSAYTNDYSKGLSKIWERLRERYGSAESVHHSVMKKLDSFPKIAGRETWKLYELSDVLAEIQALKQDPKYSVALSYFDSSVGVSPIISLVPFLQERWAKKASDYKRVHDVAFPPFFVLADFINEQARVRNDPGLPLFAAQPQTGRREAEKKVFTRKTEFKRSDESPATRCPIHKTEHGLEACRVFKSKPFIEKRNLVKQNALCFKCFSPAHRVRDCRLQVKCDICSSNGHHSLMHRDGREVERRPTQGGERPSLRQTSGYENKGNETITTKCTALCGDQFAGRSCAKTILVKVFPTAQPEKAVLVYAVHDEQSNKTIGSSSLFDSLQLATDVRQYSLNSCSGTTTINARHVTGLSVQSFDGARVIEIPELIECDIPNDRSEIPTPEDAHSYSHLEAIANNIPDLSESAEIGLLIGRDVLEAHHVEQQILGPKQLPYAQKLPLGWVVVGEVCLGKFHKPRDINCFKTSFTKESRPTIFTECKLHLTVKECNDLFKLGEDIFRTSPEDETISYSQDDLDFLQIMHHEMKIDEGGQWKAPLPFKNQRPKLPNNRIQALRRAESFDASLQKNLKKKQHMVEFMQQILDTAAAEVAPPVKLGTEVWYLPLFGVYHPRKPDKIRGVFNSSVEYKGVSLNSVLLSGPNFTNNLLGVLLRFRRDKVAVMSDVQQMFYSFLVNEEHRDYLRFFWHAENDPDRDLVEYRMRVHVFGNTPSPAVATFGLRKAVAEADAKVKNFVERDFYVDDGLTSCASVAEAVNIVQRQQQVLLQNGNIKLHKVASNSAEVLEAFPVENLEKTLKTVDIFAEDLPTQASLGLGWNLEKDAFVFSLNIPDRPFTRRGVLSAVSSLFDPLGFITPITVAGRIIVRELTTVAGEWDQPLPEPLKGKWEDWKSSLETLRGLYIPRMFTAFSLSQADSRKVHIFSDASEKAISAVAYIVTTNGSNVDVGFIIGKSKLSPTGGTTIPRLELCAAVLASQLATVITKHLDLCRDDFTYHTDSKIVLGYLNNRTRSFYTYVCNRVQAILKQSNASQWCYVPTQNNPADLGTRCLSTPEDFLTSPWITGPDFLKDTPPSEFTLVEEPYHLVQPEGDRELRPEVVVRKTNIGKVLAIRFENFSTWSSLIRAISFLKRTVRFRKGNTDIIPEAVELRKDTEEFVLGVAQNSAFEIEIGMLRTQQPIHTSSSISTLAPYLDCHGVLRVGGRIKNAQMATNKKHPVILPSKSHIALLIVRHFHNKVYHQGRLITEAAIRDGGFWIIGAKRLVASILHECVTCRRLRGKFQVQRMGDLPEDRLAPGPPFTVCGVDVFGPWSVVARRTRGGIAENKRWAVLFTCMATRAVPIEVLEDMTSSAFINALRRFVALRGPVKEFRSDRGTNFIGALESIKARGIFVEDGPVHKHLQDTNTIWRFNPPHASHMGGSWERMIGIARRILDSMFLNNNSHKLTHEVLCTFMCEVCAVMNSRPIAPISTDPENPEIISPAMLLTQKTEPLQPLTTSTDVKDLYRAQWKYVQVLSNTFWKRWRNGYLQTLQQRCKWANENRSAKVGDVVLLKDAEVHRNQWPMGVILETFPSASDGLVRSVKLQVTKDGKTVTYVRPVTELVFLVE